MHRFYLPNLLRSDLSADRQSRSRQTLVLTSGEAHHAVHVLRLKVGDELTLFDGRGHEAQCMITETARDTVRLTALQHSTTQHLRCLITLAQAIPKKSMDLIVQKATELGVAAIVPLISERTVTKLASKDSRMERWREIALEACKQSGNNWLPEIHPPQKVSGFLSSLGKFDLKLIASLQSDAKPLKSILSTTPLLHQSTTRSVLLLIGPEGDFTPAELDLARSVGCIPLSLGPLVLRAETAALYALSILHHELHHALSVIQTT
jgi:16S rRNA (uracil1498-N3)-methyltransferase